MTKKLKDREFNYMSQERQADGFVIIKLSKDGEAKSYKLKVKDPYGENEEVLSEEVITNDTAKG